MPCYSPLTGYRAKYLTKNGKRPIVFNTKDGFIDREVTIPCGMCQGCRLEYSRQWAVRCVHEAQMHPNNSFLTLTYNNENIPCDHSISKRELQHFMRSLRAKLLKKYGTPYTRYNCEKPDTRRRSNRTYYYDNGQVPKVRYFACGEYGDQRGRPHYHIILFGYDFFDDRVKVKHTKNGNTLYRSPFLESVWDKGYSYIGEVSFESAAYVARYVFKKRKGKPDQVDKYGKTNEDYYRVYPVDDDTGEIQDPVMVEPEFVLMSRKPGIGKVWLDKFKMDTDKDYVTIGQGTHKLPRYYDNIIQMEDEIAFEDRKRERQKKANARKHDTTPERLSQRLKVKQAQLKQLKRSLED